LCAGVLTLIATTSQAVLVGELPATPGGTDYQAYYDTVANLTWLADANAGFGSNLMHLLSAASHRPNG
jgi:hypothetical protein